METYADFKKDIADDKPIQDYYLKLVHYTEDILLDIVTSKQVIVAQELNMTPVKLSHILPLLKALHLARKEQMHCVRDARK